jgi:HSP20 family protein
MEDILNWDPFRDMFPLSSLSTERSFVPMFDVKETSDSYVFQADLPGVKEDDIEISLTGNRLTVSGHRDEERREEGDRYYAYERSYGSFSRSFTLPEGVDHDKVHAELKHGVLTVTFQKKPEVQPKRIELKGKGSADVH